MPPAGNGARLGAQSPERPCPHSRPSLSRPAERVDTMAEHMTLRHTNGFYQDKLLAWKSQLCHQLQVPYNTADLPCISALCSFRK